MASPTSKNRVHFNDRHLGIAPGKFQKIIIRPALEYLPIFNLALVAMAEFVLNLFGEFKITNGKNAGSNVVIQRLFADIQLWMIQADQVRGLPLEDEGRNDGIQCRQVLSCYVEAFPRFDKHRLVAAVCDIASVKELIETTATLVLAPITHEGGYIQLGARIVLWLEVLAGGITEPAVATQFSALRRVTRTNVTPVAHAKQSAGIVWLIKRVMRLMDTMALDLFGDGRWVFAQHGRNGRQRSSNGELPLDIAAVLKCQVLLVAGNKFAHSNVSYRKI